MQPGSHIAGPTFTYTLNLNTLKAAPELIQANSLRLSV